MTESNQTSTVPLSVSKGKKPKIFFEHGKDALGLALSVANMQEQKALRKAEKHHQSQVGKSRDERKNRDHNASEGRKRLEAAKATIAKRRAEAKKERAKSRKRAQNLPRRRDDATPVNCASTAPRKRVSFA